MHAPGNLTMTPSMTMQALTRSERQSVRGFTLIEMMFVVAIIGILTAIAVPSYMGFVEKSRRTDATAFLSAVAGEQVRYFSENNAYASTLAELGYADTKTENGHYDVTIARPVPSGFTLTATVVTTGPQARDTDCATLTINSTGARSATTKAGTVNPDCW